MSCLLMTSSQLSWGLVVRFLPLCILILEIAKGCYWCQAWVVLPCNVCSASWSAGECCWVNTMLLWHLAMVTLLNCGTIPIWLSWVVCNAASSCSPLLMLLPTTASVISLWPLKCIVGDSDFLVSDSGQAHLLVSQMLLLQTPFVVDSDPFCQSNCCWCYNVCQRLCQRHDNRYCICLARYAFAAFRNASVQDWVQMKQLQGPEQGTADCVSSDISII